MRERLIELLKEAYGDYIIDEMADVRKKLADYLLENGIAALPCKVGDEVYFAMCGEVLKATVTKIELNYFTAPQEWITIECNTPYVGTQKYKSRIDLMFGKTVFFTKEEAEIALAERGKSK